MIEPMDHLYSRRTVLLSSAALGATILAACSGNGGAEDDPTATSTSNPDPSDPPAEPTVDAIEVADVEALVASWERAHLLRSQAALIDDAGLVEPLDERLDETRAALDGQIEALTGLLAAAQIDLPEPPEFEPDDDDADDSDDDTEPDEDETDEERAEREEAERQERLARQIAELADALAADASTTETAGLVDVTSLNLPMLVSIAGSRGGCAQRLGRAAPQPEIRGPSAASAAALVDVLRPAVYAFEMLAAQTSGDTRSTYQTRLTVLGRLSRRLTDLGAGDVGLPPLGYRITHDLTSVDGRRALVSEVLLPIAPVAIGEAAAQEGDGDAIHGLARVIADVSGVGAAFGVPAEPFPGMTIP